MSDCSVSDFTFKNVKTKRLVLCCMTLCKFISLESQEFINYILFSVSGGVKLQKVTYIIELALGTYVCMYMFVCMCVCVVGRSHEGRHPTLLTSEL